MTIHLIKEDGTQRILKNVKSIVKDRNSVTFGYKVSPPALAASITYANVTSLEVKE